MLLAGPAWAAAAGPEEEQTARVMIIVSTVLVAIVIGLLLYQFSQRSSTARFHREEERAAGSGGPAGDLAALLPMILQELSRVNAPAPQREQAARNVSNLVAKAMEEQVGVVRRQMNDQYGQLIEENRREVTVLQRKYQDVVVEKKQTAAVLESIAEGLVVVNNKGDVVMMNPAAERLLAVSQKDRIGKPLLEDLRDEQLVSLAQGTHEDREIVLSAKQDATKRVLRASNAMVTDEDGRTVGMVAVLSDVTKQRELDQMKSEFVSKVSHELRTPLVAMQHALSILHDEVAGPLSEEQQKFVSLTVRNLERLNGLINDLLDLSKLEAGKMPIRLESIAIGSLIQTVCESLDAWARSKTISFIRRIPDRLPSLTADAARITQVLTNLIGNAVKFTPKQGRVTVEAKLDGSGAAVEISVTDTGVGIAKEDLPKLFSKFQQVGERSGSDLGGTGLGLAIAKEIVELHGGRIWAESDSVKKGARFAFTLPLAGPPQGSGTG